MSPVIELTPAQTPGRFCVNVIRPRSASNIYQNGRIDIDVEYDLLESAENLTAAQLGQTLNLFAKSYDITAFQRSPCSKAIK
jgi:hypothetical protein